MLISLVYVFLYAELVKKLSVRGYQHWLCIQENQVIILKVSINKYMYTYRYNY